MSKRDIYTDPRPGDVVQVWPVGCAPPSPLVVTDVDDQRIHYRRGDKSSSVPRRIWSRTGAGPSGPGKTLELLRHDPAAVTDDLFGVPA